MEYTPECLDALREQENILRFERFGAVTVWRFYVREKGSIRRFGYGELHSDAFM